MLYLCILFRSSVCSADCAKKGSTHAEVRSDPSEPAPGGVIFVLANKRVLMALAGKGEGNFFLIRSLAS